MKIILDTNILISALRSKIGASYKVLSLIQSGKFQTVVSVPLVFEYEEVALREAKNFSVTIEEVNDIIDYLCAMSEQREIFFLWRPFLPDPYDDAILELAVESQAEYIVTYNKRDFVGSEQFGVSIISPKEFLKIIGE